MNMQLRKYNPLMKIINNSLIDLPTPSNISLWWNYGSMLGLCLMIQIITGLLLTMHYSANIMIAFDSIIHIMRDVNYGWLIRMLHANGASFFFICMYIHIGRGIYYNSYMYNLETWMVGVLLMFTIMATAFMGYVLPWGQMSFWGATVITNLMSAIPYLGNMLVQWVWGGFAIDNATLTRFYSFHFLLPFIISALTLIHLLMLHQKGSNNPLGLKNFVDKITFNPYFMFKDLMTFIMMILFMSMLVLMNPYLLSDPDNFIPANPLVTPIHIQPEWYFLFAYAILRSIPNKLGGVMALVMSIFILLLLPMLNINKMQSTSFYLINKFMYWSMVTTIMLLTWIGMKPVNMPYILVGQIMTFMYFFYFTFNPFMINLWDKKIN